MIITFFFNDHYNITKFYSAWLFISTLTFNIKEEWKIIMDLWFSSLFFELFFIFYIWFFVIRMDLWFCNWPKWFLDLGDIARAKFDFDVVGHYARPEVLSLIVRDHPANPVTFTSASAKNKDSHKSWLNQNAGMFTHDHLWIYDFCDFVVISLIIFSPSWISLLSYNPSWISKERIYSNISSAFW